MQLPGVKNACSSPPPPLPTPSTPQKPASSSAAGFLQNISSAKLTDCIMLQDITRTHGNLPFVKIIHKRWKNTEISQGNLAFYSSFFYEMEVGCYFYRQMLEYCCNPLKSKGVLFFFFLRNAFPIRFWDGVRSTLKSFHLSATLQFSKTLKQTLSCKHLSKSPPHQHKGSWRRRDLPSFLKRSTWWTAFLNRGLSVRLLSGARKPVVSTMPHRK